jgi:hypothetical protein
VVSRTSSLIFSLRRNLLGRYAGKSIIFIY